MYVIGIDIGGTSVKGIVTDEFGNLHLKHRIPTKAHNGQRAVLETVRDVIQHLLEQFPNAQAIGIGSAGRVDTRSGKIVFATENLPDWQGTHLSEEVSNWFGLPTYVDNDANAALLGEAWLGAGKQYNDLVMLTLGTGVGGANMINGQLVRGANYNGGEWGHAVLIPNGASCNCGRMGCVEQYLSGTALTRIASEQLDRQFQDGHAYMDLVRLGNQEAIQVLHSYVELLAIFLGNLQLGIDPQAIVIGGGIIDTKELWWEHLQNSLHQLQHNGTKVNVIPAELGNDAGAYGAARLAILS